jgi:hypothetical protein
MVRSAQGRPRFIGYPTGTPIQSRVRTAQGLPRFTGYHQGSRWHSVRAPYGYSDPK